jgi:hypothetical protein
MGRMNLGVDNTITFKQDTHQYFDRDQNEFQSVTRILKKLQVPFDKAKISSIMASQIAKEQGISQSEAQTTLLSEWDVKRDSSIDRGESIHKGIELFLRTGNKIMELAGVINFMRDLVQPFYRYYPETILYDTTSRVAGQTDLIIQRQKGQDSIYDFYDYKTNESKGIQFDSIGRKADPIRHYNRMFLHPLEWLEDCNYNLYSLQLSLYAYLAQITYGIRVGRLAIIFINNDMQVTLYPVAYLKLEAMYLLTRKMESISLPIITGIKDGVGVSEPNHPAIKEMTKIFTPGNDEEDWTS